MATIRGAELAITETGDGRPVVWGHGLTSSRSSEDRAGLFGWLAPGALEGVRLIRYDARGHGASAPGPAESAYHWPELARDMVAVADHLGLDSFVAAGASMGAATSLWVAVTAPERLDALVLVIPPTAWETRAAQADFYRGGAALVESGGLDALIEARASVPPAPLFAPHPDVLADGITSLLANDPGVLPTVFRGAAGSDLPDRHSLRAIDVPTLILAWEGDPGHPAGTGIELAGLIPGAQLHIASDLDTVRTTWPTHIIRFLAALPGGQD
ncbi:MAG: alpha/beta hydrolase [Acidimicrobiales bacterium]